MEALTSPLQASTRMACQRASLLHPARDTGSAGAAVAGLVTAIPQLVWLSEHKPMVFGIACALLIVSGGATRYSRTLPCPTEPAAAQSCKRLRRINAALYSIALVSFAVGLTFAFILPRLT